MRENGSLTYEGRKGEKGRKRNYHFPHSLLAMHADVAFKFFSDF